jgi:type II secretory pathway predicted ATPase ExeA
MYEDFYGFTGKPFEIIPDPHFLYRSPNHINALDHLQYAIERNSGIILLTGEIGSGKTTLIKYLRQHVDESLEVAVISNTSLPADEMLSYLLIKMNIEPDDNKAYNLHYFRVYLESLAQEGRRFILVFDEAQNLPKDSLEEIRMLSNLQSDERLPLQIFLVGQPELKIILKSPGMNQIRQRVAVNFHLKGLNEQQTRKYINYRLKIAGAAKNPFSIEATKLIYRASSGIPREINILCDAALVYGFAEEKHNIGSDEVKTVLSELDLLAIALNENCYLQNNDGQAAGFDAANTSSQAAFAREEHPGMGRYSDTVTGAAERDKWALQFVNEKLAKIEFKMDQYKDAFFAANKEFLETERKRFEKLLAEYGRIKAECKRLKSALDAANRERKRLSRKLAEAKAAPNGPISDRNEQPDKKSNVYKIEK